MEPLTDHVIVCGLDNLGFRIAEQLHLSGVPLVVVANRYDDALAHRLERWGVPFVSEPPHLTDTLLDVGISTAGALIACTGSDLRNLETALLAAELAPELRQVVLFANAQLGDQLRRALPGVQVLSLSGEAGPSFVEAAIRSDVLHAFTMDSGPLEQIMQVVDVEVDRWGSFRHLYGNLTPISLRRGEETPEVCPGRDTAIVPGDRVALLGRPVDFRETGVHVADERNAVTLARLSKAEALEPRTRRRSVGGWFADIRGTIGAELDRPFQLALLAVLSVIVVSTIVLTLTFKNHTVLDPGGRPTSFTALDALYFVVETIATVGYGDYNFAPETGWLKIFGVGLIIVGVVSLSTVYAFITNVVVSRRLERAFGRGRATTARDHVIVSGLGSIGIAVVSGLLAAGRRVVVIERDENNRYLSTAREMGVPVVLGDATVPATLAQAGLSRAATLAAVTSDDVANLETVLSAREAFARDNQESRPASRDGRGGMRRAVEARELRVVLRMFDTELAEEVERRFGIHTARSASALAAPYFVGAALGYQVVSTFYVDRSPFIVARMRVRAGGGLDGPTLAELSIGARVVATAGSEQGAVPDFRPGRGTRLLADHELLVVGPYAEIIETFRLNRPAG